MLNKLLTKEPTKAPSSAAKGDIVKREAIKKKCLITIMLGLELLSPYEVSLEAESHYTALSIL